MTKAEREEYRNRMNQLSDADLENEYYACVMASLGSEAEEMLDRGYDLADVIERERYERDTVIAADILEQLCVERGIKLWAEVEVDDS